jgi:hypothetical protein
MSFRQQFDSGEWLALQLAPFLVLSGVSGRYRGFRTEEMQVFERWLSEASRAPGNLNREVLQPVSADVPAFAEAYDGYGETIVGGLAAVGRLLVGQPLIEVELFGDALINILGVGMTRARGPYGKEATPEGEQMLTMLEEFLRPRVVFPAEPGAGSAA